VEFKLGLHRSHHARKDRCHEQQRERRHANRNHLLYDKHRILVDKAQLLKGIQQDANDFANSRNTGYENLAKPDKWG
jgi:hypothetical protein